MTVNGTAHGRTRNVIPEGKDATMRAEVRSQASPEAVYDLLADVRSHLEWGGERNKKRYRLTSIEVGEGPAARGTEFSSTGVAPDGSFSDRSVVTEASRPHAFEFVTDARITTKKNAQADWTVVNRYEIHPLGSGSRVVYSQRLMRATALPGANKLLFAPILGGLMKKMGAGMAKPGLKNLAAMAEGSRSGR